MEQEKLDKLKAIIKKSPCPHGCKCHKASPEDLCKAKRLGLDSLLQCLEENPVDCTFAFPFGGTYFCKCTTRMEIARLLEE